MTSFILVKNGNVTPAEVGNLRKLVNWIPFEDTLEVALKNTDFHYSVHDGNILIGFVRVISDRSMHALIADLMVHPQYQRHGLGKQLLQKVVSDLQAAKFSFIELTFYKGQGLEQFYKECGFELIEGGIIKSS